MVQKFIMIMLSLSGVHTMYGAEVECVIKGFETQSLMPSKAPKTMFTWRIAQLPHEVQANIWSKLFSDTKKDDEVNNQKLLSSSLSKGLGIKLFCRAQECCPLKIRNKVFGWQDLIFLTRQEQQNLLRLNDIVNKNDSETWAKPFEKDYIFARLSDHTKEGVGSELSSFKCQGLQATEGFLCTALVFPSVVYSCGACLNGCSATATCGNPVIHGCAWGCAGILCLLGGSCYLSEHLCGCPSSR